jgi:hypothetical protein
MALSASGALAAVPVLARLTRLAMAGQGPSVDAGGWPSDLDRQLPALVQLNISRMRLSGGATLLSLPLPTFCACPAVPVIMSNQPLQCFTLQHAA